MIVETDGIEWISRRSDHIRGSRGDLIMRYEDVPCIRIDVQLLYKARTPRPKDELDFHACLPRLDAEAKNWLAAQLRLLHPEGHAWLAFLERTHMAGSNTYAIPVLRADCCNGGHGSSP